MFQIDVTAQEKNLDFIFGHRFHCNKFPVEIAGEKFEVGKLKFFGPYLGLNIQSMLYEGRFLFFEQSDGTHFGDCQEPLDFTWLLTTLVAIKERTAIHVAYTSNLSHRSERPEVGQHPTFCQCRR
jgi:hypothetical protein